MRRIKNLAAASATTLVIAAVATPLPAAGQGRGLDVFAQREALLAEFAQVPRAQLEAFFLRCERESRAYMLPLDEAVRCAMAWDALLHRGFRGDVEALLAWWRARR